MHGLYKDHGRPWYSWFTEKSHLTATGRHLPYGIKQQFLITKLAIHTSISIRLLQPSDRTCCSTVAVPQLACVGRHLTNRNEMRISGSDSYALLVLFIIAYLPC